VADVEAVVDERLDDQRPLPAISARRRRRISSSLFPENIGPQITSSQPPR
jgi:hypothetical protein